MTFQQIRALIDSILQEARHSAGDDASHIVRGRHSEKLFKSARALSYVFATEFRQNLHADIDGERAWWARKAIARCLALIDASPVLASQYERSCFCLVGESIPATTHAPGDDGSGTRMWPDYSELASGEIPGSKIQELADQPKEMEKLWNMVCQHALDPEAKAARALYGLENPESCVLNFYVTCAMRNRSKSLQVQRAYCCLYEMDTGVFFGSEAKLREAIASFDPAFTVIEYFVVRDILHEIWADERRSYTYVAVAWRNGKPGSVCFQHCLSNKNENDREIADYRGHRTGMNEVEMRAGHLKAVLNITLGGDPEEEVDWAARKSYRVAASLLPPINIGAGSQLLIRAVGDIHRVPFEDLPLGVDGPLGTFCSVLYVKSPVLVDAKYTASESGTDRKGSLLVGACDFDHSDADAAYRRRIPERTAFFEPLDGTADEIAHLDLLCGGEAITGVNATKPTILDALSHGPALIHFATHAFAVDRQRHFSTEIGGASITITDPKFSNCIYSAIALSGANGHTDARGRFWANPDSLLEVHDILRLDLSQTKLVFLSACETGLGIVDFTDETESLRGAFLSAGVKCVVSSLWPVADADATQFVRRFYAALCTGKSVTDSLHRARIESEDIPASVRHAFVAVGINQSFGAEQWK